MEGARKSRNPYKLPPDYRSDRKSATGMNGDPKKGGRGGKFTWEGADGFVDEDYDLIAGAASKNHRAKPPSAGTAKKKGDPAPAAVDDDDAASDDGAKQ